MRIPLILLDLLLFLAIAYLYFFVFVYWLRRKEDLPPSDPREPFPRIAILIPAHDEENGIEASLLSIKSLDYPVADMEIIVVADNCSDGTASVARRHTNSVYERTDPGNRGKGFALHWAMENTDILRYDAIVFLDSDCVVPRNFLKVMAWHLQQGERIIQSYNGTEWDARNPFSILSHVGNVLENRLFNYPKSLLPHLTAFLQGTGMCISTEILRRQAWRSFSITEDIGYALELILTGERIRYTVHTFCMSSEASTRRAMTVQKVRWTSGWRNLLMDYAGRLLHAYRVQREYMYLDALFSLLLQNKTVYLSLMILLFVFSVTLADPVFVVIQLSLIGFFAGYVAIGFFCSGLYRQKGAWKGIALSPVYLAWMAGVFALSLAGRSRNDWFRTPRGKGEQGT